MNASCRPIYALINLHGQICIAIIVVVVCVYIYMYWLICIVLSDQYMFRGSLSHPGPGENTCKRGKKNNSPALLRIKLCSDVFTYSFKVLYVKPRMYRAPN